MHPLHFMVSDTHEDKINHLGKSHYIQNYLNNQLGYSYKNKKQFGHNSFNMTVDIDTEYKVNNFGFRDKNWEGYAEVLAVGCSNTYGVGLPSDGVWPSILAKKINKEIRNLSKPGVSIQELVFQIFAYCKEFGNPKTIVCLFPDPFRMIVPTKKDFLIANNINSVGPTETVQLNRQESVKEYLKRPYNYNDFLTMEFPLFFSMKALHMLEQYCNSNEIELIWSCWDFNVHDVFNKIEKLPFNSFVNDELYHYDNPGNECHEEYREIFLKYFDRGQDIENGYEHSHPGVHWQIHVAEIFYKNLKGYGC